jgi:hypothetical protein
VVVAEELGFFDETGKVTPCPGRGAAFLMPLRRAGTVPNTGVRYGPGSAAHRFAKSYALHCVRGTSLSHRRTYRHLPAQQLLLTN